MEWYYVKNSKRKIKLHKYTKTVYPYTIYRLCIYVYIYLFCLIDPNFFFFAYFELLKKYKLLFIKAFYWAHNLNKNLNKIQVLIVNFVGIITKSRDIYAKRSHSHFPPISSPKTALTPPGERAAESRRVLSFSGGFSISRAFFSFDFRAFHDPSL